MKLRLPNDAIAALGAFALTGLAMIGSVAVSDYGTDPLFAMLEIGA